MRNSECGITKVRNAECGMRNFRVSVAPRLELPLTFRVPHSAFRIRFPMPSPLVACVPNFSEGRNQETLDALRAALTSVPDVKLLDVQADASHHRSVFTFVAPPEAALEAGFRAMRVALERIDLTKHKGEHPRMGATDVVPFVPVRDATLEDCVGLARRLAERAASELQIPIYLYARAAARPERERLPRGGVGGGGGAGGGGGGGEPGGGGGGPEPGGANPARRGGPPQAPGGPRPPGRGQGPGGGGGGGGGGGRPEARRLAGGPGG